MLNSRAKGKRIELEATHALRGLGIRAERTAQHQGKGSSGDIVIAGTTVHCEVKGYAAIAACRFMDQAIRDARSGSVPLVLMRENRGEWMAMLRLADAARMAIELRHAQEHSRLTEVAEWRESLRK